jgi:hypothetical protein
MRGGLELAIYAGQHQKLSVPSDPNKRRWHLVLRQFVYFFAREKQHSLRQTRDKGQNLISDFSQKF